MTPSTNFNAAFRWIDWLFILLTLHAKLLGGGLGLWAVDLGGATVGVLLGLSIGCIVGAVATWLLRTPINRIRSHGRRRSKRRRRQRPTRKIRRFSDWLDATAPTVLFVIALAA